MARFDYVQTNFTRGELSPRLQGRIDFQGFFNGVEELNNMVVIPHGGVMKRPGTRYVAETKADSPTRLLPFEFSVEETYVLEMGGSYVRFIDTAVLGPVEIRMRLQPNSVLWLGESSSTDNAGKPDNTWYRTSGGADSYASIGDGYEIKQAYLFMDTISFVDDFYRALLARRLETGTMLTIPYHNFFSFSKAINSSSDTMTFNLATQSLDMLAVVMRDQRYTNRYVKAWNQWTNNSSYFSSLSLDYNEHYKGDTSYQFQVNNLLVPTWPVKVEEAYPLTRAALDLASDYSGSGGNVRRLWDYKWGRFLFA